MLCHYGGGGAEQSVSQQGLKHKPALSVTSTCGLSQTDCTLKTAMSWKETTKPLISVILLI